MPPYSFTSVVPASPIGRFDGNAGPDAPSSTTAPAPKKDASGQPAAPDQKDTAKATDAFIVFNGPAHFRTAIFDSQGVSSPNPAATIYEGMTLRVRNDGTYFVKLNAETIPTTVQLRLQLRAYRPLGNDPKTAKPSYKVAGTVTLPIIRFEPNDDQVERGDPIQWRWEQQGYSHLLHEMFRDAAEPGKAKCDVVFDRTGVAHIGSVPRRPDY